MKILKQSDLQSISGGQASQIYAVVSGYNCEQFSLNMNLTLAQGYEISGDPFVNRGWFGDEYNQAVTKWINEG